MRIFKLLLLITLFSNKAYCGIILLKCHFINHSDRAITISQYDKYGNWKILYSETIKDEKYVTLKFKIDKPGIIFFNDYALYVHPYDTIKLFYQRLYSTRFDSLSVKGKNAPYYTFFYQLLRNRVYPGYNFNNFNDSMWANYKNDLITIRNNEIQYLNKYTSQNHLSKAFYEFAYNEIKYRYFINCLLPNYSVGRQKSSAAKIPLSFYYDVSLRDFDNIILSSAYFGAMGLYNKYLVDMETNYQLDRYSSEYLSALYDMANKTFNGDSKKRLFLNILNEYKTLNSQSYLTAYKSISAKIREQYSDPVTLNLIDSLYNAVVVLNKPFPGFVRNSTLIDMEGKQCSFDDLINKHKGKVIYADFWATWCGPCVKEMPNSILMQKEYEGKDVAFIFLSLDYKGSFSLWNKTSKELHIEKEQYLVDNDFKAELSNFIGVGAIPKYFIVDKKGNLVSKSVPRPNTIEAKAMIDKLLVE